MAAAAEDWNFLRYKPKYPNINSDMWYIYTHKPADNIIYTVHLEANIA